jgi:hypothetical protein
MHIWKKPLHVLEPVCSSVHLETPVHVIVPVCSSFPDVHCYILVLIHVMVFSRCALLHTGTITCSGVSRCTLLHTGTITCTAVSRCTLLHTGTITCTAVSRCTLLHTGSNTCNGQYVAVHIWKKHYMY